MSMSDSIPGVAKAAAKVATETNLGRAALVGMGAAVIGRPLGVKGSLEGGRIAATLLDAWRILRGDK